MKKNCSDTIAALTKDLRPTTCVMRPKWQFLVWIVAVGLLVYSVFLIVPLRDDIASTLLNPFFILDICLLMGAFLSGSYYLFANTLPDVRRASGFLKLSIGLLSAWVIALVARAVLNPTALWGACHNAIHCMGTISAINAVAAFLIWLILRRNQVCTLLYVLPGLLVSITVGTAVVEWTCVSLNPLHLLVGHGTPMLISGLVIYGVLRWWQKRTR